MTILVSLYVLIIGHFQTEAHAETSEPTYLRLKVTNPSFFQTMHQQSKPVWCGFFGGRVGHLSPQGEGRSDSDDDVH